MLSKIWGLVALVLVVGASYTLWKSGIQEEAKTELTTEINQQTEIKVKNDEAEVEKIFIDGGDDDVIDSVVSGVLAADAETNDYDGELRSDSEDTSIPTPRIAAGAADVELQDGSGVAQAAEKDTGLAPSSEDNKPSDHGVQSVNERVPSEALVLTEEEMEAAQMVLGDGCISEVVYLENGLTKTVETCPE